MKRKIIFTLSVLLILCFILSSCTIDFNNKTSLSIPVVEVDVMGNASWSVVENASGYSYKINNGEIVKTFGNSVKIEDGQYIQVRADGKGNYLDSAFSEPIYYRITDCEHMDADEDGACDKCSLTIAINLTFLSINDLHGKFVDTNEQPGVDELTTYLKDLYRDNSREEILLSTGDMWQGTVESSTNRGALMTEWMNEVSFSAMALGNHEFDWGVDYITQNAQKANFPFIAINVRYKGAQLAGTTPSVIVERKGFKVGIIGAIGNCRSSISGEYNRDLHFIVGDELTQLVKDEATRLRAEGCRFIVYAIHEGPSYFGETNVNENGEVFYDMSLSDGYIDLVFEGHTHAKYVHQDDFGVYHIQSAAENRALSCSEVTVNLLTDEIMVKSAFNMLNTEYADEDIEGDDVVNEIFEKYFENSNPYTTVVGTASKTLYSDAVCDKVAELYYEVGKKKWGDKYDIILGGGFISLRTPYKVESGEVTYADLFAILPFDNTLILGSIKGSKLKSNFINTQNDRYHCYYDKSIVSSIDDNRTYYVIVDTYTSNYYPNGITEIARYTNGVYARDLLADYFRKIKVW